MNKNINALDLMEQNTEERANLSHNEIIKEPRSLPDVSLEDIEKDENEKPEPFTQQEITDEKAKAIILRYQKALSKYDDLITKNSEKIVMLNEAIETNKTWKVVLQQEKEIEIKARKLQMERERLARKSQIDNEDIKQAREELQQLKDAVAEKESIIRQKRLEIRALEKQAFGINAMENAIPNLERLNDSIKSDIEKLTQRIEQVKEKHELAIQTYKDLSARLTELEAKEADRLTSIEKLGILQDRISIANGTERRLRYENEALSIKLSEFGSQSTIPVVAQTNDKMTKLQEELDRLNAQKTAQFEEVFELKKKIKRATNKIAKVPKQFTEIKSYKAEDNPIERSEKKKKVARTPLYKPKRQNFKSLDFDNEFIEPLSMKNALNSAKTNRVYI